MTRNNLKLPCALKNGAVIPIEEAKSGEKGYTCPGCNDDVIVRKGKKRRAHFSHKSGVTCATGYQTAIHLLAKDILSREKRFRIPDLSDKYAVDGCFTVLVSNRKVVLSFPLAKTLDLSEASITTEKRLFDRIPDIIINYKDTTLVVEIYVTHKVTEDKIADFREQKISIVEIDLSKQQLFLVSELETLLCDSTNYKTWLYNRKLAWVSKQIDYWEQGTMNGKYILYTPNEFFKTGDVIDETNIFKPITQDDSNISIVADCPRKIHYSQAYFYATDEECKACAYYVGSYESAYSNVYNSILGKGILCQKQSSYQKHSLDDFAMWLQEYAREEATKQRRRHFKFQPDLRKWTTLLTEKANSFIPDLIELKDNKEINFIVRVITEQSYIESFKPW
ncbi:competence protein CoiA family protein [uncultured Sphaerochaeta sp.]|uniref:competence protein CoiA family protein n=1 Tax=uncultured Sphaerochaeta sp. TaxID=886478 RepID=UPI002AA67597|nr:competence protein CoiA family protein [uncultured Sphaerochaeta sp.]